MINSKLWDIEVLNDRCVHGARRQENWISKVGIGYHIFQHVIENRVGLELLVIFCSYAGGGRTCRILAPIGSTR